MTRKGKETDNLAMVFFVCWAAVAVAVHIDPAVDGFVMNGVVEVVGQVDRVPVR